MYIVERSCICVLGISNWPLSVGFLKNYFGTVRTVWFFVNSFLFYLLKNILYCYFKVNKLDIIIKLIFLHVMPAFKLAETYT
jgi:hypothetical protein